MLTLFHFILFYSIVHVLVFVSKCVRHFLIKRLIDRFSFIQIALSPWDGYGSLFVWPDPTHSYGSKCD